MRRLSLKKETLAEISPEDLGGIVGGTFKTKYECTESYQVCDPWSRDVCLQTRGACLTTR